MPLITEADPGFGGLTNLKIILAPSLLLWFLLLGHYTSRMTTSTELLHLVQGVFVVALADAIARGQMAQDLTVLPLIGWWLTVLGLLESMRVLCRRLLSGLGLWQLNTLVVSTGKAERVTAALESCSARGYRVCAMLDPASGVLRRTDGTANDPLSAGNAVEAVETYCRENEVQMVVFDLDECDIPGRQLLKALHAKGIAVAVAPALADMPVQGIQAQNFFTHDVILLTTVRSVAQPVMQWAKRLFDVTVALALIVLLSPLLLVLAVAAKLDGGPLLFGHRRVGLDGRSFRCWKFRTMLPNAEAILKDILAADPVRAEEWRLSLKLKDDPRVTRLGGFLRTSSLDELPQLFNVLTGEMSLVGPRPVTEGELDHYGEARDYYLSVRPGITGLWQVSGRNDVEYSQRTLLDAWYVRNWSLRHDLAILAMTVPAVVRRHGAY